MRHQLARELQKLHLVEGWTQRRDEESDGIHPCDANSKTSELVKAVLLCGFEPNIVIFSPGGGGAAPARCAQVRIVLQPLCVL